MQSYKPQGYRWWELFFRDNRFVRRISRSFWVRMREDGYSWVKMDKEYFLSLKFHPDTKIDVEDYT